MTRSREWFYGIVPYDNAVLLEVHSAILKLRVAGRVSVSEREAGYYAEGYLQSKSAARLNQPGSILLTGL